MFAEVVLPNLVGNGAYKKLHVRDPSLRRRVVILERSEESRDGLLEGEKQTRKNVLCLRMFSLFLIKYMSKKSLVFSVILCYNVSEHTLIWDYRHFS